MAEFIIGGVHSGVCQGDRGIDPSESLSLSGARSRGGSGAGCSSLSIKINVYAGDGIELSADNNGSGIL
jgi:hypothetical protein